MKDRVLNDMECEEILERHNVKGLQTVKHQSEKQLLFKTQGLFAKKELVGGADRSNMVSFHEKDLLSRTFD